MSWLVNQCALVHRGLIQKLQAAVKSLAQPLVF